MILLGGLGDMAKSVIFGGIFDPKNEENRNLMFSNLYKIRKKKE
jgi:hypothetical protein